MIDSQRKICRFFHKVETVFPLFYVCAYVFFLLSDEILTLDEAYLMELWCGRLFVVHYQWPGGRKDSLFSSFDLEYDRIRQGHMGYERKACDGEYAEKLIIDDD